MAISQAYRLIWEAIRERKQIVCTYQGLPRIVCPTILGYTRHGDEAVMVYQIGGRTSGRVKLPTWRHFRIDALREIQLTAGEWLTGESHKQAQTFVQFVDVDVNIPDTLTRSAPLPFGSPLLRRPRQKE